MQHADILDAPCNHRENAMSEEATTKPSLRHKAVEELKEMLALTSYLYVCLGSIMLLKSAILQEVGISFDVWGIAIIKALVLAKFMLLGRAANLGSDTAISR